MEKFGYKKIKKLGEGTFGTVYKAEKDGKFYAVKRINRQKIAVQSYSQDDILNEIRLMKDLCECQINKDNCSKHVICYENVFNDSQYFYLITGYIEGMDLFDFIIALQEKKFKETKQKLNETLFHIMYLIAKDIKFIHDRGIVHRDLKPENVMLEWASFNTILIDFGFACINLPNYDGVNKCTYKYIGTPQYLAPEILLGDIKYKEFNKTDIFALGGIFYILTVGNYLFPGESDNEVLRNILDNYHYKIDTGNKQLDGLIEAMLNPNPKKRPDISDVLVGLKVAVKRDLDKGIFTILKD